MEFPMEVQSGSVIVKIYNRNITACPVTCPVSHSPHERR